MMTTATKPRAMGTRVRGRACTSVSSTTRSVGKRFISLTMRSARAARR